MKPNSSTIFVTLTAGWASIVVGEGTRCWFGNQLSLVAPRIHAYSVSIWGPELAAATTLTTSPTP